MYIKTYFERKLYQTTLFSIYYTNILKLKLTSARHLVQSIVNKWDLINWFNEKLYFVERYNLPKSDKVGAKYKYFRKLTI